MRSVDVQTLQNTGGLDQQNARNLGGVQIQTLQNQGAIDLANINNANALTGKQLDSFTDLVKNGVITGPELSNSLNSFTSNRPKQQSSGQAVAAERPKYDIMAGMPPSQVDASIARGGQLAGQTNSQLVQQPVQQPAQQLNAQAYLAGPPVAPTIVTDGVKMGQKAGEWKAVTFGGGANTLGDGNTTDGTGTGGGKKAVLYNNGSGEYRAIDPSGSAAVGSIFDSAEAATQAQQGKKQVDTQTANALAKRRQEVSRQAKQMSKWQSGASGSW